MFSTIVFAAIFIGLRLASILLWVLFLRLGLRWAKVPDVTTWRIFLATVVVIILQIVLNVSSLLATPSSDAQTIVLGLLELAAAFVVPCAVICAVFKIRFLRAVQAWLPTLLATIATLVLSLLVVRPFLFEAFVVPTNAMAPTLLGQHWQGICPECGKSNYCSPRDERYGTVDPPLMICGNFHVTIASNIDKTIHAGDRFMVAKFLTPQRWDLVVFQHPEEPATQYVKRLVGLPGETIHIQDGSVWVDGVRQTPPDSIRGIEYLSEIPDWHRSELWGSEKRPALLGDDEFFVLGDFSAQSMDSRLWQQGAPGHNSFAVPQSHIKGVVTQTFWPIHRLHIHR